MGIISAIAGLGSAYLGKRAADKSAAAASQGFGYLLGNEAVQGVQGQAGAATGAINDVLGLGAGMDFRDSLGASKLLNQKGPRIYGDKALGANLSEESFEKFRDSTGYEFRMEQGQEAIAGSAAARGLLNSGSAAKALNSFGQNIAAQEYGNFFNQQMAQQQMLNNARVQQQGIQLNANAQEANNFTNFLTAIQDQQRTGLNAAYNTAAQGQAAGQAQGQYITQGAQQIASGLGVAVGGATDWWSNGGKNWFQNLGS